MKVDGTRSASQSRPVGPGRAAGVSPAQNVSALRQAAPAGMVADSASIMGIPEAELTPKVRAAIMALMAEVDELRREIQKNNARLGDLEHLADTDPLLPVLNRRAFLRELSRIMSYAERYNAPASLIYFDLDHFKSINDDHGHAAGDEALKQVARILIDHVRASDIVGRLGGDEFGVILAQASALAAGNKGQKLARLLNGAEIKWQGRTISLSASYGIYAVRGGESPADALAGADRVMYEQKMQRKTNG